MAPARRGRRRRAVVATVLALSALPLASVGPAAAADDLLPDLMMSQVYELRIERGESGLKKLRFGTIVWNVGDGPLDVRADGRVGDVMNEITQWISTRGGDGHAYTPPGMTAFYSGDGHNHWHIRTFVVVALFPAPGVAQPASPGGPTFNQRQLRKIGFCLTDLVRAPASLRPPGSAARIRYPVSGCGFSDSTSLRMGISVGFGDDYKPFFTHQGVDITGLPEGTYRLCATVNANGIWREIDNVINNSSWVDLELDAQAGRFRVIGQGETDCQRPAPVFYGVGA